MTDLSGNLGAYLDAAPPMALAAAFVGGVLASLSPCLYPMIPIVSGYVGARALDKRKRLLAFSLSLSYVLGMALVYALLGMIAALSGSFFGQISSSAWAQVVVANLLILFALNILEVLPMPTLPQVKWTGSGRGGMVGAFLVGAASGLVTSPCTSPVLFGLLTYVATTGSLFYGATLLFSFSLGMGMLLVVVGTFAGLLAALPRPGRWMLAVKKMLGLLLIVLAEYFLLRAGQAWF
ncbi:hypothetical protein DESUT3_17880 [Desulfuromonas versatilis]|uniref:Cytochrome C biogenesis protein transmembrane domain-containing protein n=1 Tax=Desulfuromonas versatilis TaxID=2802975 RepID=A0ABM8HS43_9BACT|nr:cytochrome c biogenesis protein CcdA [Desulfuromonas versatilis]BCR04719.1 hypothetical protein DESUT3_17880 [Desulfuromonas versatilis]